MRRKQSPLQSCLQVTVQSARRTAGTGEPIVQLGCVSPPIVLARALDGLAREIALDRLLAPSLAADLALARDRAPPRASSRDRDGCLHHRRHRRRGETCVRDHGCDCGCVRRGVSSWLSGSGFDCDCDCANEIEIESVRRGRGDERNACCARKKTTTLQQRPVQRQPQQTIQARLLRHCRRSNDRRTWLCVCWKGSRSQAEMWIGATRAARSGREGAAEKRSCLCRSDAIRK